MRALRRSVVTVLCLVVAYCALLIAPYSLFAWSASHHNITVYSDRPISGAINGVLDGVEERLATSPLNDPTHPERVFICNDLWRFALFANYNRNVGGITYALLNGNVFLRPANIDHNRLISPRGTEVPAERTLVYFLAHEITHAQEGRFLGSVAYAHTPQWKLDGYCDVVGRGRDFDYNTRLTEFRRDAPELDYARSGLYLRFQLLTLYAMRSRRLDAKQFLLTPLDQMTLENELLR